MALGICTQSPFTVRLRANPQMGIYFIHTDMLELLLERHRADKEKVRQTAAKAATDFLRSWLKSHFDTSFFSVFGLVSGSKRLCAPRIPQ